MYLSRLILNPPHRQVQQDLADCHDLHRTVMSALSERRKLEATLVECLACSTASISAIELAGSICWSNPRSGRIGLALPRQYLFDTGERPETRPSRTSQAPTSKIARDMHLVFRLRANPTKRVNSRSTTERSGAHGKRVDLRTEEDQLAWLSRKAEQGGFEVMSVQAHPDVPDARVMPGGRIYGRRGAAGDGRMTFGSVLFEGQPSGNRSGSLPRDTGKRYRFGQVLRLRVALRCPASSDGR